MKYRLVPEDELIDLIKGQMILAAFDQGGVDNWCGYSESLLDFAEDLNKEEHLVEKINCASEVFDAYAEKEVEKYESVSAAILNMKTHKPRIEKMTIIEIEKRLRLIKKILRIKEDK